METTEDSRTKEGIEYPRLEFNVMGALMNIKEKKQEEQEGENTQAYRKGPYYRRECASEPTVHEAGA